MMYLYHGVPKNMMGDLLFPLSQALEYQPDLHAQYLKKYKGREEVLERRIPFLDCAWRDVVHLLPLHPHALFELQKELGLIQEVPDYSYFQIDSSLLKTDQAVVYFKSAPGEENATIERLEHVDLSELQTIPQATVDYYKSMVGTGEPVFNYQFVPHILYRGCIDISMVGRVDLSD